MGTTPETSVADDDVARNEVTPAPCWDEPGSKMRADARRSRAKLLEAATAAFAEHGADAPLDDIARRAGVGIGTLYRHFPTRTDLQAAVYRSQVFAVCEAADELVATVPPEQAFFGWVRAMAGYLATKRGLSRALIEAVGKDSELISGCWVAMRDSTDRLLAHAQRAGVLRADISAHDVLRLVHGITIATETSPADADRLLALVLDGLRPQTAAAAPAPLAGPDPGRPASDPSPSPAGEVSG
jgi:AcrR family transcriptional regulator